MENQPTKEPNAFQLINQCHKIIEEIRKKTSLLRIDLPTATTDKAQNKALTPLEIQLEGLVSYLQELSDSYRV